MKSATQSLFGPVLSLFFARFCQLNRLAVFRFEGHLARAGIDLDDRLGRVVEHPGIGAGVEVIPPKPSPFRGTLGNGQVGDTRDAPGGDRP